MFLCWRLKSDCVKWDWEVYQIECMCAVLTVIPTLEQTLHKCVFFYYYFFTRPLYFTVGTRDGCCILQYSNAFCKLGFSLTVNELLIFLRCIMQGFIFGINTRRFNDFSFLVCLHYYAVLLRALGTPAVWVSCHPTVPADPAVTALLIIFGLQLPDSRTEHVCIRSSEQTGTTYRASSAHFYPSLY